MKWQTPRYDEIKMDAEIGSYQPDEDSPDRFGDFVQPVHAETQEASNRI
jgi:hypothetical protein